METETFEKQVSTDSLKAVKKRKAKAILANTECLLSIAFADFGKKPIAQITSPMILTCLRKAEAKGNYETAKQLRAIIGAVFRHTVANSSAERDQTYALRDAIIRPTVIPRAAINDVKALGGLLRAIDGFHGQVTARIGLQFLALLAQHPGKLHNAKGSEVDLDAAI